MGRFRAPFLLLVRKWSYFFRGHLETVHLFDVRVSVAVVVDVVCFCLISCPYVFFAVVYEDDMKYEVWFHAAPISC